MKRKVVKKDKVLVALTLERDDSYPVITKAKVINISPDREYYRVRYYGIVSRWVHLSRIVAVL